MKKDQDLHKNCTINLPKTEFSAAEIIKFLENLINSQTNIEMENVQKQMRESLLLIKRNKKQIIGEYGYN